MDYLPPESAFRRLEEPDAGFKTPYGQLLLTMTDYFRTLLMGQFGVPEALDTPTYNHVMGIEDEEAPEDVEESENLSPDQVRAIVNERRRMLQSSQDTQHESTSIGG